MNISQNKTNSVDIISSTPCKQADIITLHAPLTEQAKYFIDKERMGLMKQGVMLVKTGQGEDW